MSRNKRGKQQTTIDYTLSVVLPTSGGDSGFSLSLVWFLEEMWRDKSGVRGGGSPGNWDTSNGGTLMDLLIY